MRVHSSGDSEKNMTSIVNGETSNRKVIDHEKNRETLIHKSSEIQDYEINLFFLQNYAIHIHVKMQRQNPLHLNHQQSQKTRLRPQQLKNMSALYQES